MEWHIERLSLISRSKLFCFPFINLRGMGSQFILSCLTFQQNCLRISPYLIFWLSVFFRRFLDIPLTRCMLYQSLWPVWPLLLLFSAFLLPSSSTCIVLAFGLFCCFWKLLLYLPWFGQFDLKMLVQSSFHMQLI